MDYLPICLHLRDRACLVVGGGEIAGRKVELLHRAGAAVRIVAPTLCASLRALAERSRMRVARRLYASTDIEGVAIVIAATDRPEVNAQVAADARAHGVPVNVVDEPALCTFIMPALVDRSPVVVAISTQGASPSLARLTRSRVEAVLPARLGQLADFAKRHRAAVRNAFGALPARRRFWDDVLTGDIGQLVLGGRVRAADAALKAALAERAAPAMAAVTLLAVGDGDPEGIPLRALRALGRTDLILHESSVPAAVLELARRDAQRLEVGEPSRGSRGGWSRAKLIRAADQAARSGRPVCVVLMGDPFGAGLPTEWRELARGGVPVAAIRPAPPEIVSDTGRRSKRSPVLSGQ